MKKINIGIVDYDAGNHDSLFFFLKALAFRVVISKDVRVLSGVDVIFLPGVGAFPKAMKSLSESGIINFLTQWSNQGNPLLGICLGMQLLGSVSYELGETKGLGLIPGEIVPLDSGKWHIGWNEHLPYRGNNLSGINTKDQFYYNHSFKFSGNDQAIMSYSMFDELIPAIIKKNNTVGIQFHPEKSQKSGQKLILTIVESLVHG